MSRDYDCLVYMRSIQFEVVIPEQYVWEFMREFGAEFATQNMEGGTDLRSVDSYHEHPAGWHVTVTVGDFAEARFKQFFARFAEARSLSFRK